MLGLSHQEHDEDRKAILCLERAVEEDPYNLDALLALGVSYVNELSSESALRTLKLWVEHNPSFQGMKVELDGEDLDARKALFTVLRTLLTSVISSCCTLIKQDCAPFTYPGYAGATLLLWASKLLC